MRDITSLVEVYEDLEKFNQEAPKGVHILISLSDRASMEYDGKIVNLAYSDFFILNQPNFLENFHMITGEVILLLLRVEGNNQKLIFFREYLNGNSALLSREVDNEMKMLLLNLIEEYYQKEMNYNAINSYYYQIVTLIFQYYLTNQEMVMSGSTDHEDELFFKVLNYIDQNFQQRISLNEIAEYFFVSSSYLSKFFKKMTGQNFLTYLTNKRLLLAEKKVKNTSDSMLQIALDTGFPNFNSFSKAFKNQYNETPSLYRKKYAHISEKNTHDGIPPKIENLLKIKNQSHTIENAIEINTDLNGTVKSESWNYLINLGSIDSILRYGFSNQIQDLQQEVHFKYGRVWQVLESDIIVDGQSGQEVNFRKFDEVIDLLLDNDLIPFIELGDKPFIINKDTKRRIKGQRSPFLFFENKNWERIFNKFMQHIINRWGRKEISKWKFELWKPNLTVMLDKDSFMKEGSLYKQETKLYLERFNKINQIIKSHVPGIEFGGCGFSIDLEDNYLEEFIDTWEKESIKPDFLTVYLYPMNPISTSKKSVFENHISTDKHYFKNKIVRLNQVLSQSSFSNIPIIVTEWNFSISNRNFLQDSCFKGAFVVRSILECASNVKGFGYWLLSDLYGDYNDTKQVIHGGAGLITKDNIKKPAFYAYQFLSQMGNQILFRNSELIVTKNRNENYHILMTNFKHLNQYYFLHDESEVDLAMYNNLFEDNLAEELTIKLCQLDQGYYRVKSQFINQENGSIVEQLAMIGDNSALRKQEISYLRNTAIPTLSLKTKKVADDGVLEFTQTIRSNEIRLITIEKML
ncbi:GH39 family glycosyl hydrolase [Enterococcus durans]|nr:helix-turn-helix domain-containing protein [Enterococcus durans]